MCSINAVNPESEFIIMENEEKQKYPKLEPADENEVLEEKTSAPWKMLIFCGVVFVVIIVLVVLVLIL